MLNTNRRGFLTGLGAFFAAPAIVRIENIMVVKTPKLIIPSVPNIIRSANTGMLLYVQGGLEHPQYWENLIVESREIERRVMEQSELTLNEKVRNHRRLRHPG